MQAVNISLIPVWAGYVKTLVSLESFGSASVEFAVPPIIQCCPSVLVNGHKPITFKGNFGPKSNDSALFRVWKCKYGLRCKPGSIKSHILA